MTARSKRTLSASFLPWTKRLRIPRTAARFVSPFSGCGVWRSVHHSGFHQIAQDKELSPAPILHLCSDPALPCSHREAQGLMWAAHRLGGFCFGRGWFVVFFFFPLSNSDG